MRIIKAVGLSALGLSVMLATGCSKESRQQQAARTQSDSGSSTAPASSEEARQRGQALVRVVNAVPDTPAITVIAEKTLAFDHVDYKKVTPYKEIPASANEFAIKPASEETANPIAENKESIMSGRHYTLVAYPEPNADSNDKKVSLDVIADDLQPPPAGKARVRVINAAPGTDDVAVYLRGQDDPLFSDVDFKEAVSYKEVDPVSTTIELRTSTNALMDTNPKTGDRTGEATTPAAPGARADRANPDRGDRSAAERRDADRMGDDRNASARTPGQTLGTHTLNLEAGKSYTIILLGRGDGASRQLETLVVEDMVPQTANPTE